MARPVAIISIGASCASWRGRTRSDVCMSQDALAPALMPGSAPARDVRDQLF